jgi:hypothetical protein
MRSTLTISRAGRIVPVARRGRAGRPLAGSSTASSDEHLTVQQVRERAFSGICAAADD